MLTLANGGGITNLSQVAQDPRGLRGVGDRHDGLAADLRGEDRARLELEPRSARPIRRDAGRNAVLDDRLVNAAHRAHSGVGARPRTTCAPYSAASIDGAWPSTDGEIMKPALSRGAPVDHKTRAHQQMLMPEHRHDGAVLAHQRRQAVQAAEAQPARAPQHLEDRVGQQRCKPVDEQAGGRQAPLRFRSVRFHGHGQPTKQTPRSGAAFGSDDGAGEEIRTPDPRITNALLYQLSYPGEGAEV